MINNIELILMIWKKKKNSAKDIIIIHKKNKYLSLLIFME